MAQRRSTKRSVRRTKPQSTRSRAGKIRVTGSSITVKLDAATQKKMKECLAKSGKVTFSIKEHSFTKLPAVLENGKLID